MPGPAAPRADNHVDFDMKDQPVNYWADLAGLKLQRPIETAETDRHTLGSHFIGIIGSTVGESCSSFSAEGIRGVPAEFGFSRTAIPIPPSTAVDANSKRVDRGSPRKTMPPGERQAGSSPPSPLWGPPHPDREGNRRPRRTQRSASAGSLPGVVQRCLAIMGQPILRRLKWPRVVALSAGVPPPTGRA